MNKIDFSNPYEGEVTSNIVTLYIPFPRFFGEIKGTDLGSVESYCERKLKKRRREENFYTSLENLRTICKCAKTCGGELKLIKKTKGNLRDTISLRIHFWDEKSFKDFRKKWKMNL